ncbi:MAG: helix-turn-helix domain-containing protein [Candidatus Binatia bacterium]
MTSLKLLRLQCGLIQMEVAARAKISTSRISLIENGRVKPSGDEAARLARALGVETADLPL